MECIRDRVVSSEAQAALGVVQVLRYCSSKERGVRNLLPSQPLRASLVVWFVRTCG